ncbi:MAG: pyridoxamine 5'-phosphate oxidase family protein [Acidimicrobiales bacterium]
MARTHDTLDDNLRDWISAQHVFFVATAPTAADAHVNLSPKGYDSFRVLDDRTVAYLDLTGSGVETIAHLQDNGRLTFMFCGFEGPPRILRLFGRGEAVRPGHEDFDALVGQFPAMPGIRSVIRCHLDRIQSSCGYSVPFMDYRSERETLTDWAARKGPEGIDEYHAEKNRRSIDGLTGLPA